MVAGVTGNFSIPSASNFREVPQLLDQTLKQQKLYNYKPSPNVKNYRALGKLIINWKKDNEAKFKNDQYGAFKGVVDFVINGKGKDLMQKLTFNPTGVSPTFKPEVIRNNANNTITGTTFTAKLK